MLTRDELAARAAPRKDRPGRWVVDARLDGRRIKGYGSDAYDAADDWLLNAAPAAPDEPTVADVIDTWWDSRHELYGPNSLRSLRAKCRLIRRHVGRHLVEPLGVTQLQSFATALHVAEYSITYRAEVRSVLHQILDSARGDRLLLTPPQQLEDKVEWRINGYSVRKVDPSALPTEADVNALLAHLPPRYHLAIVLVALTGVRISELCAFTTDRLADGVWTVDQQFYEKPLRVIPHTKTHHVRLVFLPDWVLDSIESHLAVYGPARLLPNRGGRRGDSHAQLPRDRSFILSGKVGGPLHPQVLGEVFRHARDKAGIRDSVTMHKFRHAYVSYLVNLGLPLAQVCALTGHQNERTLHKYTHAPSAETLRSVALQHLPISPTVALFSPSSPQGSPHTDSGE